MYSRQRFQSQQLLPLLAALGASGQVSIQFMLEFI
jgi:hypothetical protein